MPVGELLGYASALISDLGLGSFILALAVISIAIALVNRLFDR